MLISGAELDSFDRGTAVFGVVTLGLGSKIGKVFKVLPKIMKGRTAGQAVEVARKIVDSAGFSLGKGSAIRKINLKSSVNPNWGLTSKHIRKHFFGDSKHALKQIDPGGTSDKWMHHLTELFQSPVTSKTSNGMVDVIKTFPKSSGGGTFKMGIRLQDNGNGTFELVTILTRQ